MKRLQQLNAPKEELDLIAKAKNNSDALVATEDAAMKVVASGYFEKARTLMFDSNYDKNKSIIMELIKEFQNKMNTRYTNETAAVRKRLDTVLLSTIVLIEIITILEIITFIVLHKKISQVSYISVKLNELAEQSRIAVSHIQSTVVQVKEAFENLSQSGRDILGFVVNNVKPNYELLVNTGLQYEKDAEFINV